MTGYYTDPDKLTFDKAETLVEQFIDEKAELVSRVTSRDVASHFDIEKSRHNLIRLNDALNDRLAVVRESGAKATQYRVE